jgi:hypothetical protein
MTYDEHQVLHAVTVTCLRCGKTYSMTAVVLPCFRCQNVPTWAAIHDPSSASAASGPAAVVRSRGPLTDLSGLPMLDDDG